MATATPARSGPPFRLTLRGTAILVGLLGLLLVYATDQILPASTDRQAELRFWLAARATGIVAFLLLTVQIVLGLVLSHPTNRSTWNLSKRIFPWHDHLWVFVLAFLIAHIVSLVVDPKAGVSLAGAFVPGLSEYRSSPVAIGTLALYAFLVTAITARWTKLLPRGVWLSIHRLALVIWVMAWMHGVLAGTDTGALAAPVRRGGPARRRRGGLPLLGESQAEADVLDVATGGHTRMNITSLRLAAPAHDRRGRRGAGPRVRLDPGRGRLDRRVGADQASRPIPVGSIQDRLDQELARSEAMRAQLDVARRAVHRDDDRARGGAGPHRGRHRARQGARRRAQGREAEAGQASRRRSRRRRRRRPGRPRRRTRQPPRPPTPTRHGDDDGETDD